MLIIRDKYEMLFMDAILSRKTQMIEQFKKFASLNANLQNKAGITALMFADGNGNIEAIKELAKTPKINLNLKNHDGKTALEIVAEQGKIAVVKELEKLPSIIIHILSNNDTA